MDSVSSVRDSLPEQHRAHFETLRQEIITFTEVHGIPRESLGKPDLLREVTGKLSTQDLERLALLLERFEYLLKNGEPKKEEIDPAKAIEYGEKFYHLREQYDSQVELLEEVGILKEGVILGIDGHEYPVPTLEQIASRLFERRETLKTKHDQGFTKLLLVPFGMSLDALQETIKQFFIKYKKSHSFDLDTSMPLFTSGDYQGADTGDSPNLFYYPQSFDEKGHQGKTKMEILREQEDNQDSFPGWTVHLFQPSNSDSQDTEAPMGFAHIPRQGKGTSQGDLVPRPSLEASKTPNEYLSILQNAQDDKDSPYHGETGMTPEDWITAFMIHLSETGKPLDDYLNGIESASNLTGAFFLFSYLVPRARWSRGSRRIHLFGNSLLGWVVDTGVRSSVML
ncbi:TPA: hypothetical protein DDZ06_04250 [Candidatus Uhrbacteria bacterium]|nr:hypothetical protein [Candidatus Uhrbacteria bacterium]